MGQSRIDHLIQREWNKWNKWNECNERNEWYATIVYWQDVFYFYTVGIIFISSISFFFGISDRSQHNIVMNSSRLSLNDIRLYGHRDFFSWNVKRIHIYFVFFCCVCVLNYFQYEIHIWYLNWASFSNIEFLIVKFWFLLYVYI